MKHRFRPSALSLSLSLAALIVASPSSWGISALPGLLGNDLTDLGDDGVEANYAPPGDLGGFDAVFTSNDEPGFGGGEFSYNVFDNTVGGGGAKWCCGMAGGPEWIAATFEQAITLSHFTLTSGNDSVNRDPADFEVQGTNGDPVTGEYTTIYSHTGQVTEWTARNQTLRFDGGGVDFVDPAAYTTIRLITTATQGGSTTGAWFQINEWEIFGSTGPVVDDDNDGLADNWEQGVIDSDPDDAIATLADINPGDDLDSDTLTNLQEFMDTGTDPLKADSDDDGYNDNVETDDGSFDDIASDTGTDPNNPDTDGDGLLDGVETNDGSNDGPEDRGTNPLVKDSDDDGADDDVEIAAGFDPNDPLSFPPIPLITVLGAGTDALLGGDLTDPENDGVEGDGLGTGFDWLNVTASSEAYFSGFGAQGEGAFDIFDNKVGGGEAKWCCDAAPQDITVEFEAPVSLTHFTIASSNDSPQRDPLAFSISGSNDGENFTPIFERDSDASLWDARNQVVRIGLPEVAPGYRFIRYAVSRTGSPTQHALGEIEYFGVPGADAGFRITEIDYDETDDTFRFTFTSRPSRSYSMFWSADLSDWGADLDDNILSQGETTTYPPLDQPRRANPAPGLDAIFFRAELNP